MSDIQDKLHAAKRAKKDEFYTQLPTIEKELYHYRHHFKDKIVFLNCDDPEYSNFWKYFSLNFDFFGLKRLISTHYNENEPSYKIEKYEENGRVLTAITPLVGNGDFRSEESIDLLKMSDIVVTNPPYKNLKAERSHYEIDIQYAADKNLYATISRLAKKHLKFISHNETQVWHIYRMFIFSNG